MSIDNVCGRVALLNVLIFDNDKAILYLELSGVNVNIKDQV
jgi:hypothetical protein